MHCSGQARVATQTCVNFPSCHLRGASRTLPAAPSSLPAPAGPAPDLEPRCYQSICAFRQIVSAITQYRLIVTHTRCAGWADVIRSIFLPRADPLFPSPWWASLFRRSDGQALMPESYASFETALPHYGCVPEAVYTTSSVSPGRKTLSDAPIPKCIHGRRIQRDPSRAGWRARSRSELDRRTLAGADGKG